MSAKFVHLEGPKLDKSTKCGLKDVHMSIEIDDVTCPVCIKLHFASLDEALASVPSKL